MRDPEFDEIDALLNGDTDIDQLLGDESIEEVDELDALLGSIDDDFLSADEDVFLKNKEYLSNASTHELEATFTKQQEEMMDNLEDILEEYSGGCMSGEHFGLDQDHEEIDAMEDLLDVVEFEGDDEDEFGIDPFSAVKIASSPREQRLRRRIARTRKRKARRKGILDRVVDDVTKTASGVAGFFNPQTRRQRRVRRSDRRTQRRVKRINRRSLQRTQKNKKKCLGSP